MRPRFAYSVGSRCCGVRAAAGRTGWFGVALGVAGVLVTLVLVVAGAGFAWLGSGPISLESLQPAIAASLQSRLQPGYHVALGPTSISRGAHGLGVGFQRPPHPDPQGRVVLGRPGGRIGLDAFALLSMQVKVRRLELDGLQLALQVGPHGELSLAAAAENAAPISLGASPADSGLDKLGADRRRGSPTPWPARISRWTTSPYVDGRLTVQNDARGAPALYDDLRLAFDRSGAAAKIGAFGARAGGALEPRGRGQDWRERSLDVEAHDLAAEDFPASIRIRRRPPSIRRFRSSSRPSRRRRERSPRSTPPSRSAPASSTCTIPTCRRSRSTRRQERSRWTLRVVIAIDKIEMLAGSSHLRFGGVLAPPDQKDARWRLHLHSADVVFAGAQSDEPSAVLDNVDLDAHFDPAAATFAADKFVFSGPHLNGSLAAELPSGRGRGGGEARHRRRGRASSRRCVCGRRSSIPMRASGASRTSRAANSPQAR